MTYVEHLESKIRLLKHKNDELKKTVEDIKNKTRNILESIEAHNEAFYMNLIEKEDKLI